MRKRYSSSVKIFQSEFSREELIERIRRRTDELAKHLPITRVILFGSYASGRQTATSDVDLLIVYSRPKRNDDYSVCWDTLSIPQLELFVYTEQEYETLKALGSTLPKEVEKKGIVVWTR